MKRAQSRIAGALGFQHEGQFLPAASEARDLVEAEIERRSLHTGGCLDRRCDHIFAQVHPVAEVEKGDVEPIAGQWLPPQAVADAFPGGKRRDLSGSAGIGKDREEQPIGCRRWRKTGK